MVEVVTLGETMLRLSPVTVSTLEETQQFQVAVGGANQTSPSVSQEWECRLDG